MRAPLQALFDAELCFRSALARRPQLPARGPQLSSAVARAIVRCSRLPAADRHYLVVRVARLRRLRRKVVLRGREFAPTVRHGVGALVQALDVVAPELLRSRSVAPSAASRREGGRFLALLVRAIVHLRRFSACLKPASASSLALCNCAHLHLQLALRRLRARSRAEALLGLARMSSFFADAALCSWSTSLVAMAASCVRRGRFRVVPCFYTNSAFAASATLELVFCFVARLALAALPASAVRAALPQVLLARVTFRCGRAPRRALCGAAPRLRSALARGGRGLLLRGPVGLLPFLLEQLFVPRSFRLLQGYYIARLTQSHFQFAPRGGEFAPQCGATCPLFVERLLRRARGQLLFLIPASSA